MPAVDLAQRIARAPDARLPRRPRLPRSLDVALPGFILALVFFACFVWPVVYPIPDPVGGNVRESNQPVFSPGHLFGTDANGNDNWSRVLHGGRASLLIGIAVNLIGLFLGGLVGGLAAYAGGLMDSILMRVLDVIIAFPSLVLVLAIGQVLGASHAHTILALAFFSVPAFARVARAATLRLRDRPFMLAAKLSGTSIVRVLLRHVAPNIFPQLATFALLGMGVVIIIEGALSFLGLGIPPPKPSWGNMIYHGQQAMFVRPALVLLPSAFLFLTVLSFNLLGDGLRIRLSRR